MLDANSPAFVVYWALQRYAGWSEAAAWRVTTQGATVLFFVLAGVLLARFWRATREHPQSDDALLWRGGIAVIAAFLLVGSFWIWPWYLLWVVVLAALLPTSRFTTTVLPACCAGALWLYVTVTFFFPPSKSAAVVAPADAWDALTWIGLVVGAVALVLFWRAMRRTDRSYDAMRRGYEDAQAIASCLVASLMATRPQPM